MGNFNLDSVFHSMAIQINKYETKQNKKTRSRFDFWKFERMMMGKKLMIFLDSFKHFIHFKKEKENTRPLGSIVK